MTTKRAAMAKFNEVSRLARKSLTGLGLARELKNGHGLQEILYKRRLLENTPWGWVGLLEVDTQRLPRKVDIPKLVDPATVHHVQGVIGHRVKCHNTTGVFYLVELDPQPRVRLPRRADFDFASIPTGGYQVPLGVGRHGPVWRSLADLDCILVSGTRRRGKSVWLNVALVALLEQHGPDSLQLAIIDPKAVEFAAWRNVAHLLGDVATDAAEAETLLWQLAGELERRKALFVGAGVKKLADWNAHNDPLPAVVLVVDELADLVLGSGGTRGEVFKLLARLVSIGGALGLHAILATQTPRAEVIAGTLKANVTTRLSFWLPSVDEYRIVLNPAPGASFPKPTDRPGRLVAKTAAGYHLLQAYYLPDEEIAAAVKRASRAHAADTAEVHALDAETEKLIRWAVDVNDGVLTLSDIMECLDVGQRKASKRASRMSKRGLLFKDSRNFNRQTLTDKAVKLVETEVQTDEAGD